MSDDRPDSGGPPDAADERTLFERIGGMKTLVNGVDVFYDMVLEDGMLAPFFEGVDQARQRIKQVQFLCYAFGGKDQYLGKSIAEAHAHLITARGVNRSHFRRVAALLQAALEKLDVPPALVAECMSNLAPAAAVFPEVGEPAVVGPEPVPAKGTPAALAAAAAAAGRAASPAATDGSPGEAA